MRNEMLETCGCYVTLITMCSDREPTTADGAN
jgi:hypothetical protein